MENELKQGNFEGWAMVEMMGHQREVGYVTTEAFGGAVMFRVEVPEIPTRTIKNETAERAYFPECGYLDPGQEASSGPVEARTRLISPASIYALNPCTEKAARVVLEKMRPPLRPIGGSLAAIGAPDEDDEEDRDVILDDLDMDDEDGTEAAIDAAMQIPPAAPYVCPNHPPDKSCVDCEPF